MTARLPGYKQHFAFLDGMRGIAALLVGWLHASQILVLSYHPTHAFLAVDFFFCLSGFVIAYAYDDKLGGGMSFRDFAIKRLIRLYPMIFCGIAMGTVVSLFGDHGGAATVAELALGSLLLLPLGLLFHQQGYPINNPIWSLFFELFANVIYALERRFGRINNPRIAILILATSATFLVVVAYQKNTLALVGFNSVKSFVGGFVRVSFPFLAGVFIYRYSLFKLRFLVPSSYVAAAFVVVLLAPVFPASWLYESICVIVIFPVIVITGAGATYSNRMSRIWSGFGKLSYPFYLVHQPIIRAVGKLPSLLHLPVTIHYVLFPLSMALAIGCSCLVVTLYDEPVRRRLSSIRANKRLINVLADADRRPLIEGV